MTARELIERLGEVPGDSPVYVALDLMSAREPDLTFVDLREVIDVAVGEDDTGEAVFLTSEGEQ